MAFPIERVLNNITRTLEGQGRNLSSLNNRVGRIPPNVQRVADNEERVIVPRVRSTNTGVLEMQRETLPRLQNQANNIRRNVTDNGAQTERLRELLTESMTQNAECCEELRSQAGENKVLIQNNLKLEFNNKLTLVKNNITLQFNNVTTQITETTNVTNNLIRGVENTFVSNYNSLNVNLRAQFSKTIAEITVNRTLINEVNLSLRTHISVEIGSVISNLRIAVTTLSAEISAVFDLAVGIETSIGGIVAQIFQLQININAGLAGIFTQIAEAQFFIIRSINKSSYKLDMSITREARNLDSNIHKELDEIKKKLDEISKEQKECCDKLPRRLGEVVSDYVIGESYYRWDATSTYFCTLIFKFKETNVDAYAKVSQLKVRLKQRNEEITDCDIQDLKSRAPALEGMEYTYGRVRAYYVSPDKRFKTSLFSNSREDANTIYTKTLSYINDVFDPKNVSYTEKIERENNTSRTTPLDGIPVNPYNYKQAIHQKLFKIVLIVNGISRPITIYQFKP